MRILPATTSPFSLSGTIALGWIRRLNSKKELRKKTKCRIILMPPAVEPAQAPINKSTKNSMVSPEDHLV